MVRIFVYIDGASLCTSMVLGVHSLGPCRFYVAEMACRQRWHVGRDVGGLDRVDHLFGAVALAGQDVATAL